MYDAIEDPYCYPGTTVLQNLPDLRSQVELDKFELLATTKRADEALPLGGLDASHYCAIHYHLFQDVYVWAGKARTVRISRDGSMFCYPEHIEKQMRDLFESLAGENHFRDLDSETFARKAADFISELNAVHPFREGNGRTQNTLLVMLANQARHPLDLEKLEPEPMVAAMVASFFGDTEPLESQILQLMRVRS